MNLDSIHLEFGNYVQEVKFLGMEREKIGWQQLPWLQLLKNFDLYFIQGNPRVLSNVLLSLLLRLLGKKVIIEGQLHTSGSVYFTEKLRLLWWSNFNYIFLYNDKEIESLKKLYGFNKKKIIAMNNGLNQDLIESAISAWPSARLFKWQTENQLLNRTLILSCARLEPKNCFHLLINALPQLLNQQPDLLWCIIGEGLAKKELQAQAKRLGVDHVILWLGAIYQEDEIAPWFLSAKTLIHPNSIGLSLLHAFGYGLPVVTHNNPNYQMPEFLAIENNKNGIMFKYADNNEMVKSILEAIHRKSQLTDYAKLTAVEKFNTRIMAHRFQEISQLALK